MGAHGVGGPGGTHDVKGAQGPEAVDHAPPAAEHEAPAEDGAPNAVRTARAPSGGISSSALQARLLEAGGFGAPASPSAPVPRNIPESTPTAGRQAPSTAGAQQRGGTQRAAGSPPPSAPAARPPATPLQGTGPAARSGAAARPQAPARAGPATPAQPQPAAAGQRPLTPIPARPLPTLSAAPRAEGTPERLDRVLENGHRVAEAIHHGADAVHRGVELAQDFGGGPGSPPHAQRR